MAASKTTTDVLLAFERWSNAPDWYQETCVYRSTDSGASFPSTFEVVGGFLPLQDLLEQPGTDPGMVDTQHVFLVLGDDRVDVAIFQRGVLLRHELVEHLQADVLQEAAEEQFLNILSAQEPKRRAKRAMRGRRVRIQPDCGFRSVFNGG